MALIAWSQTILFVILSLVAFVIELWALIDCARNKTTDFQRAFKRTKSFWLGVTGAAAAGGFLALPPPIGLGLLPIFLQLIAVTAACVYLADVRPALKSVRGTTGNTGPYGPW
ncbi:hypothetical protein BKD30_11205 [Tersicoccus phoenicis]|uniref:DUF2516 domain-containing protein n=1 Tax=Tersicoccus phoenicis TaxID=554083 RepID=A0A1R1L7H6_9MICC|nr:DUF2516 family protein [Tersicoccus phoenicis]OMH23501.1 hypothetical protein BKD30_11205 [Tersicoccus phoenicis]